MEKEEICIISVEQMVKKRIAALESMVKSGSIESSELLLVTIECSLALRDMLDLVKVTTLGLIDAIGVVSDGRGEEGHGNN